MVKKESGTQFLISDRSKKQFLMWELKKCLGNILFCMDNFEFVDDERGQKRETLRKAVLNNVNSLYKVWVLLSPVPYFNPNDEDDRLEYQEMMEEIYGKRDKNAKMIRDV